jgi:hypothetical protein
LHPLERSATVGEDGREGESMREARLARLASALTLAALVLAGCSGSRLPGPPAPAPIISESPDAASTIMTCDTIATEHAGIAQSLQRLGPSTDADELRQRDAALARLAAQKGCAAF